MLERLVDRLFDYAGMYPPESLDFEDALATSAALPTTLKRPHLVSADLVVEPKHLGQVDDENLIKAGFDAQRHVGVCVTGVKFADGNDALDRIRSFHAQARESKVPRRVVALEVFETRPFDDDVEGFVRNIRQLAIATTGGGIALYFEPRWKDALWSDGLETAINVIREAGAGDRAPVGLKVRCAGPSALAPTNLARVIAATADRHMALKATQGLHHPIVEKDRYPFNIGFLGLVVAHRLRIGLGPAFSQEDILSSLTEADPHAFAFDDRRLAHRHHVLDGEALDRALVPPLNIGTCSLQEPDDDLARLYGLPTALVRRGPHNP